MSFLASLFSEHLSFATPMWFYAMPLAGLPFLLDRIRRRKAVYIASCAVMIPQSVVRNNSIFRHGTWFFRSLAMALLLVALARPQFGEARGTRTTEGVDIMLAVDTSGSMRARDFEVNGSRPDRLEVIKAVMSEFIDNRPDDRIGMVVFGSEAYTQAPLTLDHDALQLFLENVEIGMAGEGTAIGDGLAVAIKRLKDSPSKSHLVVLLTDGTNNSGRLDPLASASAAKALNIRVHTIGVGKDGVIPIEKDGRVFNINADIDEATLKAIASETGGVYRRATDTDALINVYREIDKLEKTKQNSPEEKRGRDVFPAVIAMAAFFLVLEIIWRATKYRRLPV